MVDARLKNWNTLIVNDLTVKKGFRQTYMLKSKICMQIHKCNKKEETLN